MADQAQVAILMQGVKAWEQWRIDNPGVKIDLMEADLSRADLSRADLSRANLSKANLSKANLSKADLSWANLGAANLREARLSEAYLIDAYLREADLSQANLSQAYLNWADLREADLRGANLGAANLREARLSEANLSQANLSQADLSRADLSRADLSRARLSEANLSWARLSGANLSGAQMAFTVLGDIDLSTAKGLDEVIHHTRSTIGIATIYLSQGKISEAFLRGAGVPSSFITYMGSLTGKALEFYSCFISYSSKDQDFAERLHADLQDNGVRCWFAPEDLKIGAETRQAIDLAIRTHDKLLLILSEHSVESDWVQKEVETAFEHERQRRKQGQREATVLFPVRLDAAVMNTDYAWAADIRRMRNIGDFTRWKDHDSYSKVFDRLLRNLKQSEKTDGM